MQKQQAQHGIGPLVRRSAGLRLLKIYANLSKNNDHLLRAIIGPEPPQQWEHYPNEDAIDGSNCYQWFYHSHSPEDRKSREHGHIHLFACSSVNERSDANEVGYSEPRDVHHLLGIGFDAQGIPISIFTVNIWVTGTSILPFARTIDLLAAIKLNTGYPKIDGVIMSVIHLCFSEVKEVLLQRDQMLSNFVSSNESGENEFDILSEKSIDLDEKLRGLVL